MYHGYFYKFHIWSEIFQTYHGYYHKDISYDITYFDIENSNDSFQFLKLDWKIWMDLVSQYSILRPEFWFPKVDKFKFF